MLNAITKHQIDKEFKAACKKIKQANKGLPWPVKIDQNYNIVLTPNLLTLQILYTDGDLKPQIYNIALL